jgi:hypothetical protein
MIGLRKKDIIEASKKCKTSYKKIVKKANDLQFFAWNREGDCLI